jgi:hypothetical protein
LLVREWITGNVNAGGMMNAPAIDLFAAKGKLIHRIAVKATGHGQTAVQWSMKPDWQTLFKGDVRPDFVIFVWFTDKNQLDDCRIFVVPAAVVDRDVLKAHTFWHTHMKRDGQPRQNTGHVAISWSGNDTEKSTSRGFAAKWKKYEDAWDLLESLPPSRLAI